MPTQKELAQIIADKLNGTVSKSAATRQHLLTGTFVSKDAGLSDNQSAAIVNTGITDYAGDIVLPAGCVSRSGTVPALANHDPNEIIGKWDWRFTSAQGPAVRAVLTWADTDAARKWKSLVKGGFCTDVSVGFDPIESVPIPGGGRRYTKWRLLEISVVTVGCNPEAVFVSKSRSGTLSRAQRMAEARALARPEYKALLALEETKSLAATASMSRAERMALAESMRNPPGAVVRELAPANTAIGHAQRMNLHQLGVQGAASTAGHYTRDERLAIARQVIAESNRI